MSSIFFKKENILEAYYGKDKLLEDAEKQVKVLIGIIKKQGEKLEPGKLNLSKENRKLEMILEKKFKIGRLFILWLISGPNASTYPTTGVYGLCKNLNNYKNNKVPELNNITMNVNVSYELVDYCDLNEREVLAIILHEIGHNAEKLNISNALLLPFYILRPILSTPIALYFGSKDIIMEKIPIVNKLLYITNRIKSHMISFKIADNAIKVLFMGYRFIVNLLPLNFIHTFIEERSSDSFAASFGYGPDLIKGLSKMERVEKSIYKKLVYSNKTTGAVNDILDVFMSITDTFIDPHPHSSARALYITEKLERDIQKDKNLPPELKRAIEEDLKAVKKAHNDFIKADDKTKGKIAEVIDTIYKPIGSDYRSIFSPLVRKLEY